MFIKPFINFWFIMNVRKPNFPFEKPNTKMFRYRMFGFRTFGPWKFGWNGSDFRHCLNSDRFSLVFRHCLKLELLDNQTKSKNAEIQLFVFRTFTVFLKWTPLKLNFNANSINLNFENRAILAYFCYSRTKKNLSMHLSIYLPIYLSLSIYLFGGWFEL